MAARKFNRPMPKRVCCRSNYRHCTGSHRFFAKPAPRPFFTPYPIPRTRRLRTEIVNDFTNASSTFRAQPSAYRRFLRNNVRVRPATRRYLLAILCDSKRCTGFVLTVKKKKKRLNLKSRSFNFFKTADNRFLTT